MTDDDVFTINAHNLLCPMPVIRVQNAIAEAEEGALIKAICTDPGAMHDIPAWARVHGHTVVEKIEKPDDNEYIIVVRVHHS
ncbi:MAG: SirA family protein [uncultured Thiotrichaceae bacterium]|uniref:SirA family protein n=1 Tax=uncultured Thiotrichaceae bacterium TaxID=298394 RepID=A0A6S6TR38_9GAMM|nr:MAG: SirA family protein [uncultured Thiotrichaceae bacterium]